MHNRVVITKQIFKKLKLLKLLYGEPLLLFVILLLLQRVACLLYSLLQTKYKAIVEAFVLDQ